MKCEICNGYGELIDSYFCSNCDNLEHIIYTIDTRIKCKQCRSVRVSTRIMDCPFCRGTDERGWVDDILRPIDKLIENLYTQKTITSNLG